MSRNSDKLAAAPTAPTAPTAPFSIAPAPDAPIASKKKLTLAEKITRQKAQLAALEAREARGDTTDTGTVPRYPVTVCLLESTEPNGEVDANNKPIKIPGPRVAALARVLKARGTTITGAMRTAWARYCAEEHLDSILD